MRAASFFALSLGALLGGCAVDRPAPLATQTAAVDVEICRTLVLRAGRTYSPSKALDDERALLASMRFAVPADIRVLLGNAGNQKAELSWVSGGTSGSCTYRGGASTQHPSDPSDVGVPGSVWIEGFRAGSNAGRLAGTSHITDGLREAG